MLPLVVFAALMASATATPYVRGGCVVIPVWEPVASGYTKLTFDGTTLCAINTSNNFVCTTPATTPLSWYPAYSNVNSGVVGQNWAMVTSGGQCRYSRNMGPSASWSTYGVYGETAVAAWGDKNTLCCLTTRNNYCNIISPFKFNKIDGNMVQSVVSGNTLYGLNAAGTLHQGSLTNLDSATASWAPVANAAPMSEVAAGGGRVCAVRKDTKVVCTTDNVTWSVLPETNWVHVTVFGNVVYGTDSSNNLRSYTFG